MKIHILKFILIICIGLFAACKKNDSSSANSNVSTCTINTDSFIPNTTVWQLPWQGNPVYTPWYQLVASTPVNSNGSRGYCSVCFIARPAISKTYMINSSNTPDTNHVFIECRDQSTGYSYYALSGSASVTVQNDKLIISFSNLPLQKYLSATIDGTLTGKLIEQ